MRELWREGGIGGREEVEGGEGGEVGREGRALEREGGRDEGGG